jgi:hypothetical protein
MRLQCCRGRINRNVSYADWGEWSGCAEWIGARGHERLCQRVPALLE